MYIRSLSKISLQVLADSEINVEKPEFASQPHILYVFNNMQEDHKNGERFNFSIPVHMRYHRPSDGQDFASVSFPNPDVLLKCSGKLVKGLKFSNTIICLTIYSTTL